MTPKDRSRISLRSIRATDPRLIVMPVGTTTGGI